MATSSTPSPLKSLMPATLAPSPDPGAPRIVLYDVSAREADHTSVG